MYIYLRMEPDWSIVFNLADININPLIGPLLFRKDKVTNSVRSISFACLEEKNSTQRILEANKVD